ncbi:MAG: N-acetylmuramoyl-L-alanine amidase [Desulfobacteraceae bacterium]|jgi:N-acetyl-anhydromuramyl-L-alanine amidase AmpD
MARILVRNRYLNNDRVAGAAVAIDPPATGPALISGVTNRWGNVNLNTADLTNGQHILRVTPAHTTAAAVGPATASIAVPPDRIFRSIDVSIHTTAGNVDGVSVLAPQQNNGTASLSGNPRVIVELQPVWMRSPNHRGRGSTTISMIIIHHTGTANTRIALNTFLHGGTSAHYIIDRSGRIIKMVQDVNRAHHAGVSRWRGSSAINSASIGIEMVHRAADGNFTAAQYTALLGLVTRLKTTYTNIETRNIIGHSDVGTNRRGRLGRKATDPGEFFDWQRLEAQSDGLIPTGAAPVVTTLYGGLFNLVPAASFRRNDRDDTNRFGGVVRPAVTGNPVQEIQEDLSTIGYSLGTPDGDFGEMTHWAVRMFQEHFFAGGRGAAANGRVDLTTATMIKRVRNGV